MFGIESGMAGAIGNAVAPGLMNAGRNLFGAGMGNVAAGVGTAGGKARNIDQILDYANQSGIGLEELYNRNVERSRAMGRQDAAQAQNMSMQNSTFRRGLEADRMKQETFNNMALNEQANRANAAGSLLDSYNQARNAAIQMATSSLY